MSTFRTFWRLIRFFSTLLQGVYLVHFQFKHWSIDKRQQAVQDWAARGLQSLGVQVVCEDQYSSGPSLWVANHISWLDVLVLLSQRYCHLVAKSEIRHWPVVGQLATHAGTLFIERSKGRDALRVLHQITSRLQQGHCVGVFPEGTTSDGTQLLPLHANLLQAAVETKVPIQVVGVTYQDARTGHRSVAAKYTDDDTILGSLWRIASASALQVKCETELLGNQNQENRHQLTKRVHDSLNRLLFSVSEKNFNSE